MSFHLPSPTYDDGAPASGDSAAELAVWPDAAGPGPPGLRPVVVIGYSSSCPLRKKSLFSSSV